MSKKKLSIYKNQLKDEQRHFAILVEERDFEVKKLKNDILKK